MPRSSSIGANIAEGCGRRSDGEFARFLLARGSASEVEYHLLLARDLKFMPQGAHQDLERKLVEVQRMLTSLVTVVANRTEGRKTAESKSASAALGASS